MPVVTNPSSASYEFPSLEQQGPKKLKKNGKLHRTRHGVPRPSLPLFFTQKHIYTHTQTHPYTDLSMCIPSRQQHSPFHITCLVTIVYIIVLLPLLNF